MLWIVASVLAISACTGPTSWPDRSDVAIEMPAERLVAVGPSAAPAGPRDLMLCIVDVDGEARCHHQAGVLTARVGTTGPGHCAGAEVQLRSPCAVAGGCLFPTVALPAGSFGLLVVELRPQAFGMPRHVVIDAGIVAGQAPAHSDVARMSALLGALADCVAPRSTRSPAALAASRLDRRACEDGFCQLRRLRLKLTARPV